MFLRMRKSMIFGQVKNSKMLESGVSECFEVGGRLWKSRWLLESRFLQPLDSRGVWGHAPPENFEI